MPAPLRIAVLLLCCLPLAFTPERRAVAQKTPGPEQQAHLQQLNQWYAQRQALQAQARQVLAAEKAAEKAGDCTDAQTTYDFNICYGRQLKITQGYLKSYEDIIRQLLTAPPEQTPPAAGPAFTAKQLQAEFNLIEESWEQYRQTACTAALRQFSGGTGGPGFEMECDLRLTRDHIAELDMIYARELRL